MILIFGVIILTAFCVNGLNIATGEGMILYQFKVWLRKKLTRKCEVDAHEIYKPLIGCVRCMPSIYGTIICLLFFPFSVHLLYLIPIVVLSSSTLATIIHSLYL